MSDNSTELLSSDLWMRTRQICLGTLNTNEDRDRAERYLSQITSIIETDAGELTLKIAASIALEILEKDYASTIKNALTLAGFQKPGAEELKLVFKTDETRMKKISTIERTVDRALRSKAKNVIVSTMPLDPNYTFEEFVVGPSNSLASASAKSIAAKPGRNDYNPFFIYGGTGLGKTHLMQAIGNEIKNKNPGLSVCYLTAETFLNEYVNSLEKEDTESFRNRYRSIDVLLVDDIQFIATREKTQDEFFNTFNSLYGQGKQIVMTSDVAPKKLNGFKERLISRFEGGMVQEIELPSYETRLAILKKKSETMTPKVPDKALSFIADNIKSHVRAMEGALAKVNIVMITNPTINLSDEVLHHILNDYIERERSLNKITVEEIQNAVCKKYSITLGQLLSKEKTASLVTPRQLAMYISKKYTTKSLPEIAKLFGKTHATIIHGVKTITKRIDVEPDLKESLEEIVTKFGYSLNDKID